MAVWILSGKPQVSQYQKKHSPTHTFCGHQSFLIYFPDLLWSMASSLFSLRAWQSFSIISPSFLWPSYFFACHPPLQSFWDIIHHSQHWFWPFFKQKTSRYAHAYTGEKCLNFCAGGFPGSKNSLTWVSLRGCLWLGTAQTAQFSILTPYTSVSGMSCTVHSQQMSKAMKRQQGMGGEEEKGGKRR